jgi:hypothetical protein
MATSCAYDNDKDRNLHSRAIQMLAEDLHVPEEQIRILYETMLCSLKETARVKDYLVILVSRNVKEVIRGA